MRDAASFDLTYEAARLWLRGKDTLEIARELGLSEADIYRHLNRITQTAKRLRGIQISERGLTRPWRIE
jgi:predicted transcriptional regulator